MATREEVIMALRHKGYQGQIPGDVQATPQTPQMPQQAPQQPQMQMPQQSKFDQGRNYISRILEAGTTGKVPQKQDDVYSKYLETILGEQAKSLYRDPLDKRNIESQIAARESAADARKQGELLFGGYDANGEPIWIIPPDNRKVKNMSPGLTAPYQQKATAEAELATQEADLARSVGSSFSGQGQAPQGGQATPQGMPQGTNPNAPPGTKLNVGPYNIPVNPELSESEARTFGTAPVLNDAVAKFTQLIQQGATSGGGNMQNAYSGLAVDSGWAPLTYGNKTLSDAQAELNRIKANTLFSEGGKNLTSNERQVIENLFSTSGKDTARIINDVQEGVRKYDEFIKAKRGGMYGYQPQTQQPQQNPNDFSQMSDDELRRIAGGQ